MSEQIGWLKGGKFVICDSCLPQDHETPVFAVNIGQYRQTCAACGKLLHEGQPLWPELFNGKLETLEFAVSEIDIINGVKSDPYQCPMAQALSRTYPLPAGCLWSVGFNWITRTDTYRRFESTEEIRTFILKFDNGSPVQPFSAQVCEVTS